MEGKVGQQRERSKNAILARDSFWESIWESVLEIHHRKPLTLLVYPDCIANRVFSTA